jgi:ankyrin repeat protein
MAPIRCSNVDLPEPDGPGDFDRVRQLVERGAELTARDEAHDATALEWAESAAKQEWAAGPRHHEIIDYLKSVAARHMS